MYIKAYISVKSRFFFLFIAIVLSYKVSAQSITDTILQIPDVVVSASRNEQFSQDVKTEKFSSDKLSVYTGESLSRFFTEETALNIRTCGVGGATSSLSIRGTASSHVQVNWNGFPVNSVTLGSCDISMIPASGFDRVSIAYGASGALYGSGTFGGAINLNNDLQTGEHLSGGVYLGYQTLKTLNSGITFTTGSKKVAWKMSAWGDISKNEFSYYDYIRQSEQRQTDGSWNDFGTIQNIAIKLSPASSLDAGLWYQAKAYNIPSRIGTTTFENQKDSTLKLFVGYKYISDRWSLKVKAARFNDKENYRQKPSAESTIYSIYSRIASEQYYSDVNFRYQLTSALSADAGLTGSMVTADVSAYGKKKEEETIAAFAGLKCTLKRLVLQTAVRKEWSSTFNSQILSSFGLSWEAMPDKWILRANFSQKFRKPTFNDLFWKPGGNSDLKPETGYTIETGSEVTILKKSNIRLAADVAPYYTHIRNLIVWRPSGAYWVAMNYQTVNSAGMDIALNFDFKQEKWKYNSVFKVMLNHSVYTPETGGSGETMLYSPRIITSWENCISAGIFDLTVWHHFTADRYYDEGRLLDPYNLIDAKTGIRLPVGKGKLGVHILASNITNETYEQIRLYPMPGRYWTIKLDYTF